MPKITTTTTTIITNLLIYKDQEKKQRNAWATSGRSIIFRCSVSDCLHLRVLKESLNKIFENSWSMVNGKCHISGLNVYRHLKSLNLPSLGRIMSPISWKIGICINKNVLWLYDNLIHNCYTTDTESVLTYIYRKLISWCQYLPW